MASSTPPPHCALTTSKPYQPQTHSHPHPNHRNNHQRHWSSQKVSLNPPRNPTHPSQTPNFLSLSSSKSDFSADFSGRRSTRFVSKMHFGRAKISGNGRHSSFAQEALEEAIRCCNDEAGLDQVLLTFGSKLVGSDDYTFLFRELGNRGEWLAAMRCFQFAVGRERKRNEQGKLASSMISILGRSGKVDLAEKVFENAVSDGYGNTVYAYSALISAYAKSGYCNEAIRVFETMKDSGLKPNLVTYNALIDACGKGGRPISQRGKWQFRHERAFTCNQLYYSHTRHISRKCLDLAVVRQLISRMISCLFQFSLLTPNNQRNYVIEIGLETKYFKSLE